MMDPGPIDPIPIDPGPIDPSRHVVLVGLMGTGKSTVGALVAERLGRLLLDSDSMVEARTGRTVREIWLSDGEAAYRALETDALREALAAPAPVVIAAAGGVVLSDANRMMLRTSNSEVVWLQASPDELVDRVAAQGHRPLLDDDPLGTLRSMESVRSSLYGAVATCTLVTSGRTPHELARAICDGSAGGVAAHRNQLDSSSTGDVAGVVNSGEVGVVNTGAAVDVHGGARVDPNGGAVGVVNDVANGDVAGDVRGGASGDVHGGARVDPNGGASGVVNDVANGDVAGGAADVVNGDVVTVRVELGERSYPVAIGHGARLQLPELVRTCLGGARRVAVVSQSGLAITDDVMAILADAFGGRTNNDISAPTLRRFDIGDGEHAKTLGTIESLCSGFAQWGMGRADAVLAVGGGIVTDVAGFVAASYGRGIKVMHVATTLLAMVDAAIGGKTGVNLAEGKNMVGAFWQPSAVVCDLDALATLPEREMKCGAGEMAKYHFLTGDDLLTLSLRDRIARCVQIKADVVGGDEREALGSSGGRALLNYGHTLGHALEIATDHYLKHGEAVAIGLMFAAELGQRAERIGSARVAEHRAVMDAYGLDVRLPDGMVADELLALMQRDKKALGSLTFILDGAGGLEQVPGIDPMLVKRTLLEMGAS
jgi:5-deoxy-5-amino-3-dehydroquinate synthase